MKWQSFKQRTFDRKDLELLSVHRFVRNLNSKLANQLENDPESTHKYLNFKQNQSAIESSLIKLKFLEL